MDIVKSNKKTKLVLYYGRWCSTFLSFINFKKGDQFCANGLFSTEIQGDCRTRFLHSSYCNYLIKLLFSDLLGFTGGM